MKLMLGKHGDYFMPKKTGMQAYLCLSAIYALEAAGFKGKISTFKILEYLKENKTPMDRVKVLAVCLQLGAIGFLRVRRIYYMGENGYYYYPFMWSIKCRNKIYHPDRLVEAIREEDATKTNKHKNDELENDE